MVNIGEFNQEECFRCPKQADCGAFALASALSNHIDDQAELTTGAFNEAVVAVSVSGEEASIVDAERLFGIVMEKFSSLLSAQRNVISTTSAILQACIRAQLDPESLRTSDDFKDDSLDQIVHEYRGVLDVAYPGFNDEQLKQLLDSAGIDIRYYASTGICGAIEVDENFSTQSDSN